MDDLSQQIGAWADAMAPTPTAPADPAATAASVIAAAPVDGAGHGDGPASSHRRRWVLAVAAAVVVLAGIGAATVLLRDDPSERVRAGTPTSTTATTTPHAPPTVPLAFQQLARTDNTYETAGNLHAAQTAGEVAELWSTATQNPPAPDVDLTRDVVLSITALVKPCTDLAGLERTGTIIVPRFTHREDGSSCDDAVPYTSTYLVSVAWADVDDAVDLRLPEHPSPWPNTPEAGYEDQRLQVSRITDPAVTTTLELDATTVASGDEISGTVTVVNDSGKPIETTRCWGADGPRLENDTYHPPAEPRPCAPTTVPTGTSTYPVTVRARYVSCLGQGQRPGGDPYCEADGTPPPLPAGEYHLTFFRDPSGTIPAPDPVVITIT